MNKNFAWELLLNSIKAGAIINRTTPDLKKNCNEDEYLDFKKSIGMVSCAISDELISKILKIFPEFRDKIENEISQNKNI